MPRRLQAGERKFVSVMFADIVNSSALVESVDPEEANNQILPMLHLVAGAVLRHGGTVSQVLGDGVLSLFGAPSGLEDHARRACASAAEIIRLSSDLKIREPIRIGISSGEIIVERGLNNELRVIGEAVYLAARAQQSALPGKITVTGHTSDLLRGEFILQPVRGVRLSRDGLVFRAYDLVGSAAGSYSKRAREERTPFVGRQSELTTLADALGQVSQGKGRTMVLVGEAGIGKTRLVSEFIHRPRTKHSRVVRVWLAPRELQTPWSALGELLLGCLNVKLRRRSSDACGMEFVMEMLGIEGQNIDPTMRLRLVIRRAAARIIEAARSTDLIVVVEDAHRLDSTLSLLLQEITSRIDQARVLFLLTARRDALRPLVPSAEMMTVEPLSRPDARMLSEFLLSKDGHVAPSAAIDALCSKGQGSPYFLAECAEAFDESAGAGNQLSQPFQPPATIRTLLSERMDRLPADARTVLLAMSVIGETVDAAVLQIVTKQGSKNLLRLLTILIDAGSVYQARILPRIEYKFHHSLVRDVAYATLLKEARRDLHSAVFDATRAVSVSSGRANTQLAYHAFQARRFREAYIFGLRGGLERVRTSQNSEARDLFEIAFQSLRNHPDNYKKSRRIVDISLLLVATLSAMGQNLQARPRLTSALRGARALGDKRRSVRAFSDVVLMQWIDGQLPRACIAGRLAQRLSEREKLSGPWVRATVRLGMVLANCGKYETAVDVLRSSLPELHDHSEFEAFGLLGSGLSGVNAALCIANGELGHFDDAMLNGIEALDIATRSGHPFSRIYANTYFANMLLIREEFSRAQPLLKEAVALCEDTGSDVLYPLAVSMFANVKARTDADDRSVIALWDRLQPPPIPAVRSRRALGAHWMAEAFLLTGRVDQAEEIANAAIVVAKNGSEMAELAWTMRLKGEIELRRCSWREAVGYFRQGKKLAHQHRMAPLEKHCIRGIWRAETSGASAPGRRESALFATG